MFRRVSDEQLLKNASKDIVSGSLKKLRILQSLPLKKINDSHSSHSSVANITERSSIRSFASSTLSNDVSLRSSLLKSRLKGSEITTPRPTPQQSTQSLLQKHFERPFTKSVVQYLNKDWSGIDQRLVKQTKLQGYVQSVIHRSNWLKQLIQSFMQKQWSELVSQDRKGMVSILFKQIIRTVKDYQELLPDIVRRVPDQRLMKQQVALQDLFKRLLEIYDPKFSYSQSKMKQRMALYIQQFASRRNELKAEALGRIKSSIDFLQSAEDYFTAYQRELVRLKSQYSALEQQRNKYQSMLGRKSDYNPIQLDYEKLFQLRQNAQDLIRGDLENNIIKFHEERHKANEKTMFRLEKDEEKWRLQCQQLRDQLQQLKQKLNYWNNNRPKMVNYGSQVYLLNTAQQSQGGAIHTSALNTFLDKVVTPFSFSPEITVSLTTVLFVDKILFDYQLVRNKLALRSLQDYLVDWFVVRTGCRRIAQIFLKNFIYSLKQFKNTHKRFSIVQKLCGGAGFRGKNMAQDLQNIFFSTHLCWYYYVKLALIYRKKLNNNPTGYPFLPPIACQDVFKLPLRKIYEVIQQFCLQEQIELPQDYTNRVDRYCINQISKFKAKDQEFQKNGFEEIHILRQINFDLIAGFVLEYIAQLRCGEVQKMLRTMDSKQKQEGGVLGYSSFETIYRRYYKERKAKIEQIYARMCQVNQHDLLDVQNMQPVVLLILEDENNLRNIFQKLQPLKDLIISEKVNNKFQKKLVNPNSYQHFKERYYQQFYDFYDTTAFLQDVFKIIKNLIRKKLRGGARLLQADLKQQAEIQYVEEEGVVNLQRRDLSVRLQQWGKLMEKVPHFTSKVLTIDQIVIHNMRRKEMLDASQYAWKTMRQILIILGKE